jgi:DNA-directed RNA polymerase subunit RPC12/RpoP
MVGHDLEFCGFANNLASASKRKAGPIPRQEESYLFSEQMKAITCTQCGATIENVSERSVIIECEYCGARIMLDERGNAAERLGGTQVPAPDFESPAPAGRPMAAIGLIAAVVILLPIFFVLALIKPSRQPEPAKLYSAPTPVASPSSAWNPWANTSSKPMPVVNYQPRVSWDGPNDMESFADPEVDISSVSNLSSEEVKKTVFKNRTVKLRVVINTEGEIDTVETISGHPLLVEAATVSAKRSIFRSRPKPTTRVLTYTFRVLKD